MNQANPMETNGHMKQNPSLDRSEQIEREILEHIRYYAHNKKEIPDRMAELDEEWDIERTLQLNTALLALTGIVLAATVNKKFLVVPGIALAFLVQHSVQGWCPPLPLFRAMGIRTRREIDSEKFALKALLGEFRANQKTREIFEAVTE
jgi:hypothetical protein